MHRRLFETDTWQADTNWVREASAAGVPDPAQFLACIRRSSTNQRIEAQQALGIALGVDRTPMFFSKQASLPGLVQESSLVRFVGR